MLPVVLSNGLCSLNPKVDRLCMVCEMTISESGRLSGYRFYESVMHSRARLTYTQVAQVLAEQSKKRSGIRKQFYELLPHLDELYTLYQVLRAGREQRGAIDFETRETRIVFDEDRKIKRIVPTERNVAHKIIEECMLAANVCSARFLEAHELPGLYRVHEPPKAEKLEQVQAFLAEIGMPMNWRSTVKPQSYQQVMSAIEGRADQNIIQTVMLRSMNQAVYQPENKGHFGLAYTAYAHFTSPIRRYPDLLVHRAIRRVIRSKIKSARVRRDKEATLLRVEDIYPYSDADMATFGEQCSFTERRADDATRDVVSWLKCEYLRGHVGEEFDGVVSAVTAFGLFVELKDLYVEGLVHITSLPQDYYHFDAVHHRLVGERTRQVFYLGDELKVQVARVDLDERKIDFELTGVKRRGKKTKVSPTAKALAEGFDSEQLRKTGGRVPRKRKISASTGKSAVKKKQKSKASAHKRRVKSVSKPTKKSTVSAVHRKNTKSVNRKKKR